MKIYRQDWTVICSITSRWLRKDNKVPILSMNCRSNFNLERIRPGTLLKILKPDIVCLNKTWPERGVNNLELFLHCHYKIQDCSARAVARQRPKLLKKSHLSKLKPNVLLTIRKLVCSCFYTFAEKTLVIINPYSTHASSKYRLSVKQFKSLLDHKSGKQKAAKRFLYVSYWKTTSI